MGTKTADGGTDTDQGTDDDGNFTQVHLITGPDKHGICHARTWEIPPENVEQCAAMLTEAYGKPAGWIDGSPPDPSRTAAFYYPEDGPNAYTEFPPSGSEEED